MVSPSSPPVPSSEFSLYIDYEERNLCDGRVDKSTLRKSNADQIGGILKKITVQNPSCASPTRTWPVFFIQLIEGQPRIRATKKKVIIAVHGSRNLKESPVLCRPLGFCHIANTYLVVVPGGDLVNNSRAHAAGLRARPSRYRVSRLAHTCWILSRSGTESSVDTETKIENGKEKSYIGPTAVLISVLRPGPRSELTAPGLK
ncbi:hypothetical protein EVAR_93541_1 [Eumeta japonica]|uniref:Uncharacterized protein n=1 Tax=Eumeta variegata TaxID=151549 RepID=A0A4C1US97_EUMVA|nr:hypothetical protein EVAR_93541_1 [Eumeta japonica]